MVGDDQPGGARVHEGAGVVAAQDALDDDREPGQAAQPGDDVRREVGSVFGGLSVGGAGDVAVQVLRSHEVGDMCAGSAVRADDGGVGGQDDRPGAGRHGSPERLLGQGPVAGHVHLHPPRRARGFEGGERDRRVRGHREQRARTGRAERGGRLAVGMGAALQSARGDEDRCVDRRAQYGRRGVAPGHVTQDVRSQAEPVPGGGGFGNAEALARTPAEVGVDLRRKDTGRLFLDAVQPARHARHTAPPSCVMHRPWRLNSLSPPAISDTCHRSEQRPVSFEGNSCYTVRERSMTVCTVLRAPRLRDRN